MEKAIIELLARRAGLDKALAEFPEDVAAAAEQASGSVARMQAPTDPRAPVRAGRAAKKTSWVAGARPTPSHSKILTDNTATADAVCVSRLRGAGAIVLGKLSTHEFAIGGPSFDLPWPPARNPWNPDHHPGGASSGAGAGISAGLFPLAFGRDTRGSVRNPARALGIGGLKPTYCFGWPP